MFNETRKKIGVQFTRFKFRRESAPLLNFSNIFSNAVSALIILPDNPEHRSVVIPLLQALQLKFKGNKLTLVVNEPMRGLPGPLAQSKIVTIPGDTLGFFYLPKPDHLAKLMREKYDVVMDLNIPLVPSAAYICTAIRAPLKVGFTKDHADHFYNFQFKTEHFRIPRMRYEQLFRTLAMF